VPLALLRLRLSLFSGVDELDAVTLVLEMWIVELLPTASLALILARRRRRRGGELDRRNVAGPAGIF
jgi:hypothetical protein